MKRTHIAVAAACLIGLYAPLLLATPGQAAKKGIGSDLASMAAKIASDNRNARFDNNLNGLINNNGNVGYGNTGTNNVGAFNGGTENIGAFNGNNNADGTSGNYNVGAFNGNFNTGSHNGNHNVGALNGNFNGGNFNGNGNIGAGNGNLNGNP